MNVPEDFLDYLLNYLEYNNAYVGTITTSAVAEVVIYWARKSALTMLFYKTSTGRRRESSSLFTCPALTSLKAKILAPDFGEYVHLSSLLLVMP